MTLAGMGTDCTDMGKNPTPCEHDHDGPSIMLRYI